MAEKRVKECQFPDCPTPEVPLPCGCFKYHPWCRVAAQRWVDTRTYEERKSYFADYHQRVRKLKS